MADTYTQPKHGWTCFHCGETFTTVGSASDHFGASPEEQPGCLVKVGIGEERGLLMALRKEQDECRKLSGELESVDCKLQELAEFKRVTGCESVNDLRMWLDSNAGRVVTANALIEGFRERSPEIFAEVIG